MNLAAFEQSVAAIARALQTAPDPYEAGFDCGRNGPNQRNCHMGLFSTRERLAAWERGKADGLRLPEAS